MNITCYKKNSYFQNFQSNPESRKLRFNQNDFFINIRGYGRDLNWADRVIAIADKASESIRKNVKFDRVLAEIAHEMSEINPHFDSHQFNHTGVLRVGRKGYGIKGKWSEISTPYYRLNYIDDYPYITYKTRFDKINKAPLKTEYEGVSLTRIEFEKENRIMAHGEKSKVNSALDKVRNIYKMLHKKYISHPENVTENSLNDINSVIAEIRWILAHSTPWERGSDAISNIFMRALYKSMGIKTYPSASGVSFDLEAYCTELADYRKCFPKYFSKSPQIADYSFFTKLIKKLGL